ncbi:MAG: beta-lactamase family protein [Desulfobacterales bacterium]|nr:beta-lactamase family protein [Desulfobacterales bacterium]
MENRSTARSPLLHRLLKTIGVTTAAVLVLALISLAVFHDKALRLYRVITLFNPDRIVENFQTMDKIFPHKTLNPAPHPSPLKRHPLPLPPSFIHKGKEIDLSTYLEETWTTGFLVLRDDTILHESYYLGTTENSRLISWSMGKSMVSALVGIAREEGHIPSIHTPVSDYVHMLKGSGYHGVSLKNVLQMSSGIRFNEDYGDFYSDINRMGRVFALGTAMDDFVLSLEPEREPGTYHHYVSMNTQVLGMVLRHTTGTPLFQYLEEKLFKPMGAEAPAYWIMDDTGMEMAFGGLGMVLRDYGRFGRIYLNQGRMGGRQIVPEEWIRASLTMDAPHLQPGENPLSSWIMGYGFQWWIPDNNQGDFIAMGICNQYIWVHPPSRTVIVKLSAYPDYDKDEFERALQAVDLFRTLARTLTPSSPLAGG